MRNRAATAGGAGLIAIVFFFVGHYSCFLGICPEDGNPVGYHLHGLVKIVNGKNIDLSNCPSTDTPQDCTLILNLSLGKNGAVPTDTPTPCPGGSNCVNFTGTTMQESSADSNVVHTPEPVNAAGAVEFSPPPAPPSKNKH